MAEPIPIYQGNDFYVPQYEVRLQGKPVGKDVVRDVQQVTYKDNIEEIDSFEIQINNWDAAKLDLKYSDDTLFDPGKKLEVWMGYFGRDHMRRMISGEITSLRPTFPASGPPTLAISGLNLLHRLRTKQESHAYEEKKDSQIAREIAGRLEIDIETDAAAEAEEEVYEYLFQDNQYDILFLIQRARRIGYDLFVTEDESGSKLSFKPTVNLRQVAYTLEYGRSMIQFQPNLTTANQVSECTVRGWDPKTKKKFEYTAKRSELSTKGVGSEGGQEVIEQSFKQRKEVVADRPISSEQEAKTLAIETLERIAKDMVKGTGSTVGLPDLRAGGVLFIEGLGKRFSGRYFVTSTTHTIGDSGYTTQFECRREEV